MSNPQITTFFSKNKPEELVRNMSASEGDVYLQSHLYKGSATYKKEATKSVFTLAEVLDYEASKLVSPVFKNIIVKNGNNIYQGKISANKNEAGKTTVTVEGLAPFFTSLNAPVLADGATVAIRISAPSDYEFGGYTAYTKNITFSIEDEYREFTKNDVTLREDHKKRTLTASFDAPYVTNEDFLRTAFKGETITEAIGNSTTQHIGIASRPNPKIADTSYAFVLVTRDTEGKLVASVIPYASLKLEEYGKDIDEYKGLSFKATALEDPLMPSAQNLGYISIIK